MRVFVAAELPEPVAALLAAWTPDHEALRAVPVASLHVTLAFLGERSEEEVARVEAVLPPLARPVEGLSVAGVRWLPPSRPRVLSVELGDSGGALGALQAAVVDALAEAIGFVAERRPFLPHVTVARVRQGRPPRRAPALELAAPDAGRFGATALTLFRSRLSPRGARYEALQRTLL